MPRAIVPVLVVVLAFLPAAASRGALQDARKLEKQLQDRDARKRAEAAWQLGQIGAVQAVPALAKALSDDSAAVRSNAAASLLKLGEASRPAEPELFAVLDDSSSAVVSNAARALAKLGVARATLVPAYRRLLSRPDCESRVRGLKGLVQDQEPTGLFDAAWDCAQAQDIDTKIDAIEMLRKILDRKDAVMVPQILEALRNVGDRDATHPALALGRQKPPVPESVSVLSGLLDNPKAETRAIGALALGQIGEAALPALPRLIRCLEGDADPETRERAAAAIGEIGSAGADTSVPALMKAAGGDDWPKVRSAALSSLGDLRQHARQAIPVLRKALGDSDSGVSIAARNALFRVDPENKAEAAALSDASRPVQATSLFEDTAQLAATLPAQVPDAYEVTIYEDFAMATAAVPSSRSGYGRFTYRAGTVTGPEEHSQSCDEHIALSKVDFSLVPRLIAEARSKLGAPAGKVSYVGLSGGVFCKRMGWVVYVEGAGMVEFKLDGKVDKVRKM